MQKGVKMVLLKNHTKFGIACWIDVIVKNSIKKKRVILDAVCAKSGYAMKFLKSGKTPQLGAVICYANGPASGLGHVMIVEKIVSSTHIVCSESGYRSYLFKTCDVYKKSNGWHSPSLFLWHGT